jgi:hypothetical protein
MAQFVIAIERAQHRQVQHAAGLARQAVAAPDIAPAVFGRQFLHRHVEVIGALERLLHELLAQHILPDGQTAIKSFLAHQFLSLNLDTNDHPPRGR